MAKNPKKNGAHKIPPGAHTFRRDLPCKLTDKEINDKGRKAGSLNKEANELQAEIAASLKEKREQLKTLRGTVSGLLKEIETGHEERSTQCFENKDYERNEVQVVRVDTMAIVEKRTMSIDERQEPLSLDKPAKGKRGRKAKAEPAAAAPEGDEPDAEQPSAN